MPSEGEEILGSPPEENGNEGATRLPPVPDDSAQLREATEAISKLRKLVDTAEIMENMISVVSARIADTRYDA